MKDHFIYIEAYIKGRLPLEAKKNFEQAMADDPDLKEAVDHYPKIEPFLNLLIEEDIRAQMHDISSKKIRKLEGKSWGRIAAAILVLILALSWMWNSFTTTPHRLYAQFYQPPLSIHNRSSDDGSKTLSTAQQKALDAHALLKEGQSQQAEALFREIMNAGVQQENEAVQWYLVMTALQAEDKTLAKEYLEPILQNNSHLYFKEAIQLQKKLNGFLGLGI